MPLPKMMVQCVVCGKEFLTTPDETICNPCWNAYDDAQADLAANFGHSTEEF